MNFREDVNFKPKLIFREEDHLGDRRVTYFLLNVMAVFNFDYFKAKLRLAIDAINEEYSDNIIAATQGIINSNYRLSFDRKYGR